MIESTLSSSDRASTSQSRRRSNILRIVLGTTRDRDQVSGEPSTKRRKTKAPKRSRPNSSSDPYSDVDDLMLFSEDETEVKIVIESRTS